VIVFMPACTKWELYLKKYYDLKFSIRFIVSGSASSPIFRSSQESLLGRIKDRHLLPFSFREFCLFRLREQSGFASVLSHYKNLRAMLMDGDGPGVVVRMESLKKDLAQFQTAIG
ncbi:MAG: AAA family ATPase, partial [Desulfobacterales bacterium]|nr:AAA family ATPase [Desulfobacterales bacterium]